MSKKKIEIIDDQERSNENIIPLDAVDANNELYQIQQMRDQLYQQAVDAANQAKSLNEAIDRACNQIPPLMEALEKTANAAENGFQVKVPESACQKLEESADAVTDKVLERLEAKSKDLVDLMTRHHNCIPVPQDIFWCLIFCLILLACFFCGICLWNFKLQITAIWHVIDATSALIALAIGLTIYLRCRK